ncbi:hypothetical protein [Ramlibacter sp. 2FC]|uniref:hypothetical protein n=1 Tax=Ramlibacter sp. 2FC TaxID=2502188 RepID=UPI0010F5D4A5|nr:hypothetical protein [Ramlibacter sp. 2FC]
MHSAPSVTYPVGRSRFLALLLLSLWLAGAGVAGLWWRAPGGQGWRLALVLAALLLAAGLAWRFWRSLAALALCWDGHSWRLRAGAPDMAAPELAGRLSVQLDLQRHLLLCLHGRPEDGRPAQLWLWAEAKADPARWHALRCAVYSRAMTDPRTGPDAGAVPP